MISKKRYWGLALPIWRCARCDHFEVIGSEEELQERAVAGWEAFAGHSPHRPWIDAVKIRCGQCGEPASRIPDDGNPWLDAGIVPFSTLRYRDDPAYWAEWFPADFITESFPGQFRNWFYSMLAMGTALENRPPFTTVLGFASVASTSPTRPHRRCLLPYGPTPATCGTRHWRWMSTWGRRQRVRPRLSTRSRARLSPLG